MSNANLPASIKKWCDGVHLRQFWWDGVPLKVPMHNVYAIIPDPVVEQWKVINGHRVPILSLLSYSVPICDPFQQNIIGMPSFAIIMIQHKGNDFALYAYPADHIDESCIISFERWRLDNHQ